MASIDIVCVNPDCDSEDIEVLSSDAFRQGCRHRLECSFCLCKFSLFTYFTEPEEAAA